MIAIRFAEWILSQEYRPYRGKWITLDQYEHAYEPEGITTIQLYSLYLESKSHEVAESDT